MKTFNQFLTENVLTSKERSNIPKDKFALDGDKYPIENRSHAANAKSRAKEELDKGNLSKAEYDEVVRKADAVLNESDLTDRLNGHRNAASISKDMANKAIIENYTTFNITRNLISFR